MLIATGAKRIKFNTHIEKEYAIHSHAFGTNAFLLGSCTVFSVCANIIVIVTLKCGTDSVHISEIFRNTQWHREMNAIVARGIIHCVKRW